MSVTTTTATIDRHYLRNRTKDEHVMRLLKENDDLRAAAKRVGFVRWISIGGIDNVASLQMDRLGYEKLSSLLRKVT